MALAPSGLIVGWPSTNASIPTGATRKTALDTLYVAGAPNGLDADLSTSRGQANHTHTSPAHTHTQNSHTHTRVGGAAITGVANGLATGAPLIQVAGPTHTHASSASVAATAVNQDATVTFNTTANDPPYYKIIFIELDGTTGIPNGAVTFFDSATLPTGWRAADGASGAPDIRNRIWKGADVAGDAGATGGSSDAHTHTQTATHNHTQNSHNHTASASAGGSGGTLADNSVGTTDNRTNHTHLITLNAQTATNQAASVTIQNGDGQPPFVKLLTIQNNLGAADLPAGVIAIWASTIASIPLDWILCNGANGTQDTRSKFVKGALNSGEIGTTGGASQHTHTADAHTHTQDTHTHTLASAGLGTPVPRVIDFPGADAYALANHTHTWTIGSTVATNQNTTITIDNNTSEDNYPPYRRVLFIKYNPATRIPASGVAYSGGASMSF